MQNYRLKILPVVSIILCLWNNITASDNVYADTLAVIGNKIITTDEFISSYREKLNRVGLTDNGQTRQQYLMNLISDRLLIEEAKQTGLDKTPSSLHELERIKTQELLNVYTLKHLSPKIKISDDELQLLFKQMNMRIKVSHLYAPTREKAEFLYNELMKGVLFS